MATNSELMKKAQFMLNLLGKKRSVTTIEVEDHKNLQFDLLIEMVENETNFEEELLTRTTEDQKDTEDQIKGIYDDILENGNIPHLKKNEHFQFLQRGLGQLPGMFKVLDASQPWITYWCLNSLNLMDINAPEDIQKGTGKKIVALQHKDGGIGGGLGQIGHCAATYSGLLSLALSGDEESMGKINRRKMYEWLMTLKQKDGSFVMHVGGETDTRAVYCALVIASLLDLITPELTEGTAEWLSRCQTFEGGFGGVPYDEAHGGYTFCGAAALFILGKETFLNSVDVEKLIKWTVSRQLSLEGGFSGRSNKLVDGCYSFWVGGLLPIFDILLKEEVASRAALQNYILGCCQNENGGGLRDKPGKNPDFYHSNYVLLGLSVAQNKFCIDTELLERKSKTYPADSLVYSITSTPIDPFIVQVESQDKIKSINPIFGLPEGVAEKFKDFYATQEL